VSARHRLALVGFVHGADGLDEGTDFVGVFFSGLEFDAGGNIDSPRMKDVNRVLDVAGMEASGNDEFADAVDDAGPGLNAFPIEGAAGASGAGGSRGIEQNAGDDSLTEAVGFEEKVSVLGDVNFLDALAFVGFVGLDEADGDGIPTDRFVRGLIEDLCGERTENHGARRGAVGKSREKCLGKLLVFAAVELYGVEADELCGFADAVDGGIDEDTNFFKTWRELGGNRLGVVGSDEARDPLVEDEADGVGAGIGSGEGVIEVRDPADFDPSHKSSCQLSVLGKSKSIKAVLSSRFSVKAKA
jgi:hypothetical protein